MKINLHTSRAQAALSSAAAVVSQRAILPMMSNALLRAEGDRLTVYAANDALTVSLQVAAHVSEPGSVTLPARRVSSICAELMGENLAIEASASGARILLASASSRFTINGLLASEFPVQPHEVKDASTRRVKQSALVDALKEVVKATSRDEARPVMQGVFFEWEGEMLTLVATDGRRLIRSSVVTGGEGKAGFIVPARAVAYLQSVLGHGAEVQISADARAAVFVIDSDPTGPFSGPITVTLRLVEGTFPAYRQVIPKNLPVAVQVRREELLAAVQRAALVCSPKHSSVTLKVGAAGIQLTVKNPDMGESDEMVPVQSMTGEPVTVRFNPGFLVDSLSSLTFDEVVLQLKDSASPLKIEIGDRYTGVIMPVRLE